MTQNYVIFSHILWRLFVKDWVEHDYLVRSWLEIWGLFWGGPGSPGYFGQLDSQQQEHVRKWVQEYHADSELMAAVFYGDRVAARSRSLPLRFDLRDFWRRWLTYLSADLDTQILEVCWYLLGPLHPYDPPRPEAIVEALAKLAKFDTPESFLRTLEKRYGFAWGSCQFLPVTVYREALDKEELIYQLTINDASQELEQEIAISILRDWMAWELSEYYRLAQTDGDPVIRVAFYDVVPKTGIYWDRTSGTDVREFWQIDPSQYPWSPVLAQFRTVAANLDVDLQLPQMETVSRDLTRLSI